VAEELAKANEKAQENEIKKEKSRKELDK